MSVTTVNQGASKQAIQDHYDLSNEFYRIWLDRNMVYSGALWEEGDSLERAQIRKLDHHINATRIKKDARLLDIGCGWGALVERALETRSISEAVGLTLSQAQLDWIEESGLSRKANFRLESWQEHQPEAPYDAIISVGAFEHFAKLEMSDSQKTKIYETFFDKARSMLNRDCYLSLQTFAYGSVRSRQESVAKSSTDFLSAEIFRETDPPHLSNIIDAIQGRFELVDCHNDRLGYAKTCKHWLDTLRERKQEVVSLVGPDVFERYEKYLSYSFIGFKSANLDLYRITLRRVNPRRT